MHQFSDPEKHLAELQETEQAFRSLLNSTGWRKLMEICNGAVVTRRQGSFSQMASIKGLDDCFTLAGVGGEIAGIQFVMGLPHIMLDNLKTDIHEAVIARRENEDGSE